MVPTTGRRPMIRLTEIQDVVDAVAASQDGGAKTVTKHIDEDGNYLIDKADRDPLSFYIARSLCKAANDNPSRAEAIDRIQTDFRYAISQLEAALEATKAVAV